jgi:hypothetical protein
MLERLPVPRLSDAGIAVMHQLSVSGERPAVLLRTFQSGTVPSCDLPELIAFAWTRDDSPTSGVSETAWIEIFESAGFLTYPPVSIGRPASPVTLYPRLHSRAPGPDVLDSGTEDGHGTRRPPRQVWPDLALRGDRAARGDTGIP